MIAGVIPEFRWGSAFEQAWRPPYPVDGVVYYDAPRAGSSRVVTLAGSEDAWIVGTDYYATGMVRWLRRTEFASDLGFAALLRFARENPVRLYPDPSGASSWYLTVRLVDLDAYTPTTEPDFTLSLALTVRGELGAKVQPVWISVGPSLGTGSAITYSRASTALYTVQS